MRELNFLQELEKNPVVSQRELSNKFGIALGMTNACLRKMVQRGWIRVRGVNHRKIGYYLTPKGFAEKTRLTLHLISWAIRHYSALKNLMKKRFSELQGAGIGRVVFYGVSDEMEVAYTTLQASNLKLVGIVEDEERIVRKAIFGFELKGVNEVGILKPDAILITSLSGLEEKMETLKRYLDTDKVKIMFLYEGEDWSPMEGNTLSIGGYGNDAEKDLKAILKEKQIEQKI